MSRSHKPDKAAVAARDGRRKSLLAKVAASAGLPADTDDLRADLLSWSLLALDLEKTRMLHGQVADIDKWQKAVDALTAIVKPAMTELRVSLGLHLSPMQGRIRS